MSTAAETPSPREGELTRLLELQRAAFAATPFPTAAQRKAWLARLEEAVVEHQDALVEAIAEDFGGRSRFESLLADVVLVSRGIRHLRRHVSTWMKPERRSTGWILAPSRSEVVFQPKGVIGIIAPWNYPVNLGLVPLATALAAGNRVMLKPSELTPRTSAVLADLLSVFDEDLVAVVQGEAEVGAAFSALPFDHILFTGSTRVGRLVMQAAAKNLVPVTLELGGKSPALVHPDYDLDRAAAKIAQGKLFNAGQTCIAPDYALVPEERRHAFVQAMRSKVASLYPSLVRNDDYTSIVNDAHRARLQGYLDDAEAKGASLVTLNPGRESFEDAGNKMAPVLVLDATDEMRVMQEEIFGPILPVVPYDTVGEAINYINARPRPLALYYFDDDSGRVTDVLKKTHSGGVSINTCLLHFLVEDLPFGGVGPSGLGAYHGVEGFKTFSHEKAVFTQSRIDTTGLLMPPYSKAVDKLLAFLR